MNKVLVFCSDMLPLNGMATSGGGLRSWQIVKGLQSHGLEVVYSMPDMTFIGATFADSISSEDRKRLWNADNQLRIIEAEKPDVIILTKPGLKFWRQDLGIPLALDFHGPDIIEYELLVQSSQPMGRYARAAEKIKSIAQADFYTCAGKRQRYYFMAFLLLAGLKLEDIDIRYMPVAMPGDLPPHEPDPSDKFIIFAGGFYPWLDPKPGLRDLAQCIDHNGYRLEIFGCSHKTMQDSFEEFKQELGKNPQVNFHGTVSHQELLSWYKKASLAFELMPRNPERELAFTTRTVEFLWAGIPVIYNDYAELSEMIGRYKAGWLVPPGNLSELRKVVRLISEDPGAVRQASENARKLVAENLTYEKVITPLAEFCSRPVRRAPSEVMEPRFVPLDSGVEEAKKIELVERLYQKYGARSAWKLGYKLLWHSAMESVRKLF